MGRFESSNSATWPARKTAEVAIRHEIRRLRRVGLSEMDVVDRVEMAVHRADRTAQTGTVRFPRAHRWKSAENEIDKIIRHERRHYLGRVDEIEDELEVDERHPQRDGGVWRLADPEKAAVRIGESAEDDYAIVEVCRNVLTKEQLEVFKLHVVDGYSLTDVAKRVRRRKADVLASWREIQERLRGPDAFGSGNHRPH